MSRADGCAGDNVEDVVQGSPGTLLEFLENKRGVESPEAAAGQAQKLALVGRDLMARGIELDPRVAAHE